MEWVQKMLFPMRRFILSVATRVRSRKNGGGLLKLHNDVQMCGYEDVQVMWEMLKKSEVSDSPKRRRPFWRLCMWTSRASSLGRV